MRTGSARGPLRAAALTAALAVLLAALLSGCALRRAPAGTSVPPWDPSAAVLRVHCIDVGQGDCTLVELPDGETLLIDAGEAPTAAGTEAYLRACGVTRLDFAVATHPHADHIGGMAALVAAFGADELWMPDAVSPTGAFDDMLSAAEVAGSRVRIAETGKAVALSENWRVTLLAPDPGEYEDLNDACAVVRVTYGATAFLFMADAGERTENGLRGDLSAQVVRVGHHGSAYSSTERFIRRTGAAWAVISVGAGNDYGHPAPSAVKRWTDAGAQILRTDERGTIVFESDGRSVRLVSNGN